MTDLEESYILGIIGIILQIQEIELPPGRGIMSMNHLQMKEDQTIVGGINHLQMKEGPAIGGETNLLPMKGGPTFMEGMGLKKTITRILGEIFRIKSMRNIIQTL